MDFSTSTCIFRVRTSDIVKSYKRLGIKVDRFFKDVDFVQLYEDQHGLRMWHPIIPGDDIFYESLSLKLPWYYQSFRPEFSLASKIIKSDSFVLEVGSGCGSFAELLSIKKYLGLELNSQAVDACRKKGFNVAKISLAQYSNSNPLSADYVVAFQLLEHLDSPSSFFESAARALKPDGLLLLSVPAENSFSGLIQRGWMNTPPHHLSRWTDRALELFPTQFGFQLEKLIHIPLEGINHTWFILTLFESLFDKSAHLRNTKSNIISRLKSRFILYLIISLGGNLYIRPEFHIRGQSVFAIYKKSSFT